MSGYAYLNEFEDFLSFFEATGKHKLKIFFSSKIPSIHILLAHSTLIFNNSGTDCPINLKFET